MTIDPIASIFLAALVSTVLSFGAGYLLNIVADRWKTKASKRLAILSMIGELHDTREHLCNRKKSEDEIRAIVTGFTEGKFELSVSQLGISAIESIVFSGLLREFDSKTQLMILKCADELQFTNKLHFAFFERLISATGLDGSDSNFVPNMTTLYQNLVKSDEECLSRVEELLKHLESSTLALALRK